MPHLIWLFSTSHSSFSLWLFCFALFFYVRYICLFHFFFLTFYFFYYFFFYYYFFIFGWDFSFTVQTPWRLNLEFWPVFTKGFLIVRVRRGFLVWESDPISKSKRCRVGKKKKKKKEREESPKRCHLRL